MQKILVTDTIFVLPQHEQILEAAGFKVERLRSPIATEAELLEAVKDKVGYIIGGVEQVTSKVLEAAHALRAIVHCGSAYKTFIPAWREATAKGIAIATVPDGHVHAVAEWAQAAALAMNRGLFDQAAASNSTVPGLESQTLGIIGLGHIGKRLAEMLRTNRPRTILYSSTHRHTDYEAKLRLTYSTLTQLLHESDVVFLCVSGEVEPGFFGEQQLASMKPNALLVSFMIPGVIDADALFDVLRTGKIRAVSDYPMDSRFARLPLARWYSTAASNAFNTIAGVDETSSAAVQSLIALLTKGDDTYVVNHKFKRALPAK